jgi:hypothetical protein
MLILDLGGQAVARGGRLSQVLDRGARAAARKAVPCESQVLDCSAEAVARGAARCAFQVLDCGAQADAQDYTCWFKYFSRFN